MIHEKATYQVYIPLHVHETVVYMVNTIFATPMEQGIGLKRSLFDLGFAACQRTDVSSIGDVRGFTGGSMAV